MLRTKLWAPGLIAMALLVPTRNGSAGELESLPAILRAHPLPPPPPAADRVARPIPPSSALFDALYQAASLDPTPDAAAALGKIASNSAHSASAVLAARKLSLGVAAVAKDASEATSEDEMKDAVCKLLGFAKAARLAATGAATADAVEATKEAAADAEEAKDSLVAAWGELKENLLGADPEKLKGFALQGVHVFNTDSVPAISYHMGLPLRPRRSVAVSCVDAAGTSESVTVRWERPARVGFHVGLTTEKVDWDVGAGQRDDAWIAGFHLPIGEFFHVGLGWAQSLGRQDDHGVYVGVGLRLDRVVDIVKRPSETVKPKGSKP